MANLRGQYSGVNGTTSTPRNVRGQNQKVNTTPIEPLPDYSIPAATIGVAGSQTASFLLLDVPTPSIPNENQFMRRLQDPDSYQPDKPDGYSPMGTPVYGRIILGNDNGDNKWTDASGKQGSYRTVELDCAVCAIDFGPKIVKTDIQGLPYSIKEFISNGDDEVTITGIYDSTPGVAPIDFIINLNDLIKAPVPIPVTNYFLNNNDIHFIVITPGTSMAQIPGEYSTQRFIIRAWSDTPMTEMLP